MSSSSQSNVGRGAFYEAGDQRTAPQSEINQHERYEAGEKASHKNIDSSMSSHSPSNAGVERV